MIPLTKMLWIFYLSLILGQEGLLDPAFDRIPFEQWLKGGGEARIRWSTRIFPSRLTVHQRLETILSVQVDGEEFVKRNGPGQVVVFVEIRGRDNRVYRTHRPMHFAELKNPSDLASVHFDQYAFITPGDYQVAEAIYDTESKEHSLKRIKLHVPGIAHDPLPGSWRDLPEVEFVGVPDPPENERPVRVEVVVNESPTEIVAGRTGRVSRRNMGNLIPALKVLSQLDIRNGSMNVTLLDLERRKVSFTQDGVQKLDWMRLRAALLENDPNQIDVHALENHEQNAQFFVSEVRKRLEGESNGDVPLGLTAEPARVLIVLSGPMAFGKGQDLRPIEATPEPGSRVFYIRYYPPLPGVPVVSSVDSRRGRGGTPPVLIRRGSSIRSSIEDSLEPTLKPLGPRLFNITTPLEFRVALAAIMSEISRLK